jgi:putative hemolysin
MNSYSIEIIIIAVCAVLSGFFSASETALFSLKKIDLHRYSSSLDRRERYIASVMRHPEKILVTILSGNLAANLILTSLSTKILLDVSGSYGHFISIAIVAPVVIIFFEITPKLIAMSYYRFFSRNTVIPLKIFHAAVYPVRFIILTLSDRMMRFFRLHISDDQLTEHELDRAVELAEVEGALDPEEGGFIKNVIRFTNKDASSVMFPRNRATFLEYGCRIDEAMEIFLEKSIIRAPVYKNNPDNIVGMIDSRVLIPYYLKYKKARNINRFIAPIRFFPETRDLNELLNDFLKERIQIAIAVDEYGGTAGIVTLNAILSELMGKGFTSWDGDQRSDIRKRGDRYSVISGDMRIDDFNSFFHETLSDNNSDTMGGYIMEKLARIPKRGEELQIDNYILKIRYIIKNRIESIEVIQFNEDI